MTTKRIKNITVGNAAAGNIARGSTDQDREKLSHTVTIRLSEKDYRMAKQLASRCGINKSALFRSLLYSVQLKARLSDEEIALLRNLADSRRDMVNFANALSGLTKEEKLSLFRNHRMMLEWYEKVAPVTDLVIEYLQFVIKIGVFRPRTTDARSKSRGKVRLTMPCEKEEARRSTNETEKGENT